MVMEKVKQNLELVVVRRQVPLARSIKNVLNTSSLGVRNKVIDGFLQVVILSKSDTRVADGGDETSIGVAKETGLYCRLDTPLALYFFLDNL